MNIGIDLDGVVYNSENWFMAFAEIYDIEHNKKGIVNKNENHFQIRYGLTDEQTKEMRLKYLPVQMRESPLMPYAKDTLALLSKKHNTMFITSRGTVDASHIEITKERLKQDNLDGYKIIFSKNSKVQVCKENQIDIMVDDSYNVVKELAENGITCLQFITDNNKMVEYSNVVPVYNWGEIYRIISEIDKNNQ